MPIPEIPQHPRELNMNDCPYIRQGNCYWCCEQCNYVEHTCGGCGEHLDHNGRLRGRKHDCA